MFQVDRHDAAIQWDAERRGAMKGHVVIHDLKFLWETIEEASPRGPRRWTLHVRFGDLHITRSFGKALTKTQAEREAVKLAPEVLRVT